MSADTQRIEDEGVGVYPANAQVLETVTFGKASTDQTGTVKQALVATVIDTASYGPSGSSLTGTVKQAPVAKVVSTESYGPGGNSLTGTYIEAAAADVRKDTVFGPAGAYTGELEAGGGGTITGTTVLRLTQATVPQLYGTEYNELIAISDADDTTGVNLGLGAGEYYFTGSGFTDLRPILYGSTITAVRFKCRAMRRTSGNTIKWICTGQGAGYIRSADFGISYDTSFHDVVSADYALNPCTGVAWVIGDFAYGEFSIGVTGNIAVGPADCKVADFSIEVDWTISQA